MLARELVGRSDRLGERDQGYGESADQELRNGLEADTRQRGAREARGQLADHGDAARLQAEGDRGNDRSHEHDQRGRHLRQPPLQHDHGEDAAGADHEGEQIGLAQVRQHVPDQGDGGVAVGLDAEKLGELLDRDQQRQTEDEAEEDGFREELGDAPELEDPERDRDETGEDRQGRRQGDVLGATGGGDLARWSPPT